MYTEKKTLLEASMWLGGQQLTLEAVEPTYVTSSVNLKRQRTSMMFLRFQALGPNVAIKQDFSGSDWKHIFFRRCSRNLIHCTSGLRYLLKFPSKKPRTLNGLHSGGCLSSIRLSKWSLRAWWHLRLILAEKLKAKKAGYQRLAREHPSFTKYKSKWSN